MCKTPPVGTEDPEHYLKFPFHGPHEEMSKTSHKTFSARTPFKSALGRKASDIMGVRVQHDC
jgi:hypothetical protein